MHSLVTMFASVIINKQEREGGMEGGGGRGRDNGEVGREKEGERDGYGERGRGREGDGEGWRAGEERKSNLCVQFEAMKF